MIHSMVITSPLDKISRPVNAAGELENLREQTLRFVSLYSATYNSKAACSSEFRKCLPSGFDAIF